MLLHLTRKERDDKYDSNQLRTEPWRPNQDDRRVSKMLWSMVVLLHSPQPNCGHHANEMQMQNLYSSHDEEYNDIIISNWFVLHPNLCVFIITGLGSHSAVKKQVLLLLTVLVYCSYFHSKCAILLQCYQVRKLCTSEND